jgi:hypothetical protein
VKHLHACPYCRCLAPEDHGPGDVNTSAPAYPLVQSVLRAEREDRRRREAETGEEQP